MQWLSARYGPAVISIHTLYKESDNNEKQLTFILTKALFINDAISIVKVAGWQRKVIIEVVKKRDF